MLISSLKTYGFLMLWITIVSAILNYYLTKSRN